MGAVPRQYRIVDLHAAPRQQQVPVPASTSQANGAEIGRTARLGQRRQCLQGAVMTRAFHHDVAGISASAGAQHRHRSEEHTSELQSLMRISYAVFCLKKKKNHKKLNNTIHDLHIDIQHYTISYY